MPQANTEEFDSQMYAETRDLLGDGFSALLDKYFSSAQRHIATIDQALKDNDAKIIADLTHNIKSTSAGFGFMEVSTIAKSMEHLCRDTNTAPIAKVNALHEQLKTALAAIENRYRSGALD